jgi:probable phosphoglycerate mutase
MSDLQCAATIIVARHGEAEYEVEGLSDDGGSLTLTGREQARELATSLLDRKVAEIWCSDMARAVQTAEIAAGVLGCNVRVRTGLREFGVGDLAGSSYSDDVFDEVFSEWKRGNLDVGPRGAETGADVVRRMTDELQSLADEYRGETTLVVTHGGVMTFVLPRLATNVSDTFAWGHAVGNCATSELAVDADGWVLRTWRGEPLDGA